MLDTRHLSPTLHRLARLRSHLQRYRRQQGREGSFKGVLGQTLVCPTSTSLPYRNGCVSPYVLPLDILYRLPGNICRETTDPNGTLPLQPPSDPPGSSYETLSASCPVQRSFFHSRLLPCALTPISSLLCVLQSPRSLPEP